MSNTEDVISTSNITKHFRGGHSRGGHTRRPAVQELNLRVPSGAVYGFLGPNGSGKSTTIRMLLGLLRPDAGSVRIFDKEIPEHIPEVLPHIGALIDGPAFHPYLTGWANLARLDAADCTAPYHTSRERIGSALERVGLSHAAQKKYRTYSLGMKQRLGLAAALLRERKLLILDEPTNGLDPRGTREVRSLIAQLASTGTTVMLSTHLLSEVEQICTHVGIMHHGSLLTQGALSELCTQEQLRIEVSTDDTTQATKVLHTAGVTDIEHSHAHVSGVLGTAEASDVLAALVHADVAVTEFTLHRARLEDVFLRLTGEDIDAIHT